VLGMVVGSPQEPTEQYGSVSYHRLLSSTRSLGMLVPIPKDPREQTASVSSYRPIYRGALLGMLVSLGSVNPQDPTEQYGHIKICHPTTPYNLPSPILKSACQPRFHLCDEHWNTSIA
jgi:hypothetical protein